MLRTARIRSPHRILTVLAAVTLVATLAGCGGDDDEGGQSTTTTVGATSTSTSSASTGSTSPAGTATVSVYYLRDEKMGPTGRPVDQSAAATGAIEALLDGPTAADRELGFVSNIPEGTKLLGLDVAGGVATVDLSDSYDDGGGTLSMMSRLAEVVFTLTQFPAIDSVSFEMNGEPVTALGGEGIVIDEPIDRTYFADLTPAILVEKPLPFETVSSPLTVAGENNTFENTVVFQLVGDNGLVLIDGHTTGTGEAGTWGPFENTAEFDPGPSKTGTLRVFQISARDGSEQSVVEIPVRF